MISRDDISAAHDRIAAHIRRTPILELEPDALGVGHALTLKLEHLQKTGSFKLRGAFNNMLATDLPDAGVVATSGGNHGAGVAHAATKLGAKSVIFVPALIAVEVKLERMRKFGAEVIVADGTVDAVIQKFIDYATETGALPVHPYNTPATIAGQGTAGLEFEQQAPDLDTILVSVGGGGLIGGVSGWYGSKAKIVAVETTGTCCLNHTLNGTLPADFQVSGISASGLGASSIGDYAIEIIRKNVDDSVVVTDDDVFEAQRRLWSASRIVAEPGGVTALAALTSGTYTPAKGEKVGVLVCGGNADPDWFVA